MNIGIAFLTKTPSKELLSFASQIFKETNFKIFVFIDDNDFVISEINGIEFIQIKDKECINNYYTDFATIQNKTSLQKNPNSWDKMAFYFSKKNNEQDFIWVLEDDVFIPSVNTIKKLTTNYCNFDLVTPNNFFKKDNVLDWHWKEAKEVLQEPFYYSMVCACGISKKTFSHLKDFVKKNKKLFYHEILLNTLAMQYHLKVKDAKELKSIVWMGDWNLKHFLLLPNNLFHPLKVNHGDLRKQIDTAKKNKYIPNYDLPDFLK